MLVLLKVLVIILQGKVKVNFWLVDPVPIYLFLSCMMIIQITHYMHIENTKNFQLSTLYLFSNQSTLVQIKFYFWIDTYLTFLMLLSDANI